MEKRGVELRDQWEEWKPGQPLLINRIKWGQAELDAVRDVFDRDWFASGFYVDLFQKKLAEFTGGHGKFFLTNSGSTALETAVMALLHTGAIRKFGRVLHPALTFNTSASCFAKFGLVPVFVDSKLETYNMDPVAAVEAMRTYDVDAVVLPHILGNTTELDIVLKEARSRGIPVIGDSCDTLGTKWAGKEVSAYTDFTAYSFYGSHHITAAGVGGAICVREPAMEPVVKSLIYWGRDWEANQNFANRYAYATLGSDYQMTEMQAAFGVAQMESLEENNRRRREVFNFIHARLIESGVAMYYLMPWSHLRATPSWFGFPLTIKAFAPFTREQVIEGLLSHKIECRPMFSGNTLKQKAWENVPAVVHGNLENATFAMSHSFFVPAWAMPEEALNHLVNSIIDVTERLVA